MVRLLLFLFLFSIMSCRNRHIATAPQAQQPAKSYSLRIYATDAPRITITVTEKETGEIIPGALVVVTDSLHQTRYGNYTNIDGQWKTDTLSNTASNIKITYILFMPLLITNPTFYPGDSVVVLLRPQTDTVIHDYFSEDINDIFSPQNRTIKRRDIRRMPK